MEPRPIKTHLTSVLIDVEGMKCGGCVQTVEKILNAQQGVMHASVNLVERTALLELTNKKDDIPQILEALANRGFPASEKSTPHGFEQSSSEDLNASKKFWKQWRQLMVALCLLFLQHS